MPASELVKILSVDTKKIASKGLSFLLVNLQELLRDLRENPSKSRSFVKKPDDWKNSRSSFIMGLQWSRISITDGN